MMKYRVYELTIGKDEIESVVAVLRRGEISGSFGQELGIFEREFAQFCGCKYGVATSSGTAALHLAIAASGISKGDEVLVSACTNIATALAVLYSGAVPVPVDSEEVTWNLNLDLIEPLITSKTKAIIPVHLYGHPVDMNRLGEIVRRYNLIIIEDAAEAHGAVCHGRRVGGLSDMGCFSFYANKIITTGEGGMVVTNNTALASQLRLLRNLGFAKPRFYHQVVGYNYRMTNYQAAMGLAQVHKIDDIILAKRRVADTYTRYLSSIEGLQLPAELGWAINVYWMYAVVVKPEFGVTRDKLMEALEENGIETRTFFCPMNQQPILPRHDPCPVADRLWETGLYLPSSPKLTESDIKRIVETIRIIQLERGR